MSENQGHAISTITPEGWEARTYTAPDGATLTVTSDAKGKHLSLRDADEQHQYTNAEASPTVIAVVKDFALQHPELASFLKAEQMAVLTQGGQPVTLGTVLETPAVPRSAESNQR